MSSSKNSEKNVAWIWIFLSVWKATFFARFSLSGSRCMSDWITSTKLQQTGEVFWDSRCCLCAWVSAFWARRMKVKWGVTLFICWLYNTYLIAFVSIQPQYIWLESLIVGFKKKIILFLETFLEGSVDHTIYREYVANLFFTFLYCSLATSAIASRSWLTGDKWVGHWKKWWLAFLNPYPVTFVGDKLDRSLSEWLSVQARHRGAWRVGEGVFSRKCDWPPPLLFKMRLFSCILLLSMYIFSWYIPSAFFFIVFFLVCCDSLTFKKERYFNVGE